MQSPYYAYTWPFLVCSGGYLWVKKKHGQVQTVRLHDLPIHYMPAHTFTSVLLQQGVVASPHRDSRNAEGSFNLLVSLTPAHGPILWIEDPQGDIKCPNTKYSSVSFLLNNPARFNPRSLHCTVVSSGGAADRIVVVAFTIKQPERLSDLHRKVLLSLCFNLPESK